MVSIVQRRYAEALYKVATESNIIDIMLEEISSIKSILERQGDFLKVLMSPQITEEFKISIIKEIFGGKVREETVGIIVLLIKKGRQNLILKVFEEFVKIAKEKKNISTAVITSAIELLPDYVEKIKERLQHMTKKEIEIKTKVDGELIGGFKIELNSTVFDRTIKSRIEELRKAL